MSDFSQAIVDVEIRPEDASAAADDLRRWLVAEGVVVAEVDDSTYGEPGHRPGPGWRRATAAPDETFLGLRTNGVTIAVGRRVFDTGETGVALRCAGCGAEVRPGEEWLDAVQRWWDGEDAATFPCPACGRAERLDAWDGPGRWGFGALGIELWNWPPLSAEFVAEVARRLGHRVAVVKRHL